MPSCSGVSRNDVDAPRFVELDTVLQLHEESITRFGGSMGVRDPGLIESAVAAAQNTYWYGGGDLFQIAATYAYHLAQAQAFLDGNKRVAVAVAMVFLAANGLSKKPNEDLLYDALIGIAEHRLTKADLAQLFRELFG